MYVSIKTVDWIQTPAKAEFILATCTTLGGGGSSLSHIMGTRKYCTGSAQPKIMGTRSSTEGGPPHSMGTRTSTALVRPGLISWVLQKSKALGRPSLISSVLELVQHWGPPSLIIGTTICTELGRPSLISWLPGNF